jgi:CubicO group peptidase (beta-lactamase class C family)
LSAFRAVALFSAFFGTIKGVAEADGNAHLNNALQKLDAYINSAMAKTKVPGAAVAVVYKGQVVFLRGYGVRQIGEPALVDPNTVFEIASVSKPIASTVVAAAVGRGEVGWDSRIEELDPYFKLSSAEITEKVTVRDLFSHRSTLPDGVGDSLEALGYTRPEILHRLRLVALSGEFRKTYHYNNFGFTEGALAATSYLGKTWEDVAQELLYSRLGMTQTSSRFSDYENRPNRAALHYLGEDGVFRNRYVREADAESPAGGVSSTARDMAQWVRLQLGEGAYDGQQIVERAALEETHQPQVCRKPEENGVCPNDEYYGLGWDVNFRNPDEKQISHSGAFLLGAGTSVYLIPSKQIGILVLTNSTPVGLPEAICLNFLDDFEYGAPRADYLSLAGKAYAALRDLPLNSSTNYSTEKPPSNPAPGGAPASFVGTYENAYFGKLEIEREQGRLILRLPALGTYYELSHWNGDTYTYYIANEVSGAARRGVKFSAGGRSVTVENLNFEYSNVFTRVGQ